MIRKRIGCLFLLFVLVLTACSSKKPEAVEEDPAPGVSIDLPAAGVSFDLPPAMQDLNGTIQSHYGMEISPGSGVYLSALTYCAMSKEKYTALAEKGSGLSEEEVAFARPRLIDFILVYTIDGGRSLDDLQKILPDYGLPTEGCQEIGSADDYRFFSLVDPLADRLDTEFVFDDGFREEYEALLAACADLSWIRVYAPAPANAVSFETTDLAGNAVRSVDLFSSHRLTMVNLWGTYCGPCINEMPDLEELNTRLQEKDCAIIGVVVDVAGPADADTIQSAEEILADTGVTYLNLVPWNGLGTALPAQFIPTSYFIDASGQIVGEAAVGARGADEYEALIDALLETLEE